MKKILSFLTVFLFLLSAIPFSALASEATSKATFSYVSSGNWKSFNGTVTDSGYIDGIKIQTDKNKNYYLQYRTWNENQTGYFPDVKSTVNDFAGSSKGLRMQRLGISVKSSSDNSSIATGIVVMYRVLVNGLWLPWVSNANPDWMDFVQRKYGLTGVLDYNSGYAGIDGSYITGIEIHIFEESEIINSKGASQKLIDAPFISQADTYPTGCESVSAVMAMNSLGFNITVDSFIDNHLPKGSSSSFDPNICFGGNPRSTSGMGCYAPVIEKACLDATQGFGIGVKRTLGATLNELCENYIDNDIPVIFWATQNMEKAYNGKKISFDGKTIQWIAPEHCLLLVGYDENNYIFNDPLKNKNTAYSRNSVENAYYALGAQTVILYPMSPDFSPERVTYYSLPDGIESPESIKLSDGSYTQKIEIAESPYIALNYNSECLSSGRLGIGWYLNFEKNALISEDSIKIFDSPSQFAVYTVAEDGSYTSSDKGKSGYILKIAEDESLMLNCNYNYTEIYSPDGQLSEIRDKNGYSTYFEYGENTVTVTESRTSQSVTLNTDSKGRIVEIISDTASTQLKYTANLLTEITGKINLSLRYTDNLRLKTATQSGIEKAISYNSENKVTELGGEDTLVLSYNGSTVTINGTIYTFDTDGMLTSYSSDSKTESYIYDSQLNLVSKTDTDGTVSYKYHSFGRPSSVISADLSETQYFYDGNANLIKIIYALKGDTDGNGYVNILDFIRLKKYLSYGQSISVSVYNSNLDGGEINAGDLTELVKILFEDKKLCSVEEYFYNERNEIIKHIGTNGNVTEY